MTSKQVEAAPHQEASTFSEKPKGRQIGGRFSDDDAEYLKGISDNNTRAVEATIAMHRVIDELIKPSELARHVKAFRLEALDSQAQLRHRAAWLVTEGQKSEKK